MGNIIHGLEKASLFDPDTGTTVQMNDMSPDETELLIPNITSNTTIGATHGGNSFEAALGFYDADLLSQLQDWQRDAGSLQNTPVELVADLGTEFLLVQTPQFMNLQRDVGVDARNGASVHVANLQRSGQATKVYKAVNLIAAGADAFTLFNGTSSHVYRFIFPVEGATLIISADYANYTGDTGIAIEAIDFSGASISFNLTSVDGNGNFESQFTLPANTWIARCIFDNSSTFNDGDITNRTIRLGTESGYVNI